jgi:hypothetical protein
VYIEAPKVNTTAKETADESESTSSDDAFGISSRSTSEDERSPSPFRAHDALLGTEFLKQLDKEDEPPKAINNRKKNKKQKQIEQKL